jgi:Kef-type K+ transport system membrane component KefB
MTGAFTDIALILALATILAAIFARFKQPLVLSHILVGIIAASSGILTAVQGPTLDFFAELGIAFALFLIGLELSFSDIRQIGRAAVAVGLGQVAFTSTIGFLIASLFGFGISEAFYVGLALTFSSTIIVVKLLGEKRDLDSLYGRITTGYLIVQDFVAIAALILLASAAKGDGALELGISLAQGLLLVGFILLLNRFFLQRLFDFLATNTEVLFLAGISWALIFSTISVALGFSLEIGAFLAGLGLSKLREEQQIASWVRPLRDLFIILFFLSLGLKLSIGTIASILVPAFWFSIFVLIGNPLIMMAIMGVLGFRPRTSFHVGITSAQVSEFSLIFIVLANKLGLVRESVVHVIATVALVTIVFSTYLIIYSTPIYKILAPYLGVFKRGRLKEIAIKTEKEFSDHFVLVGAGRLGWNLLSSLKEVGEVVVVDFNPEIVRRLENLGVNVIYGDISDQDIFQRAGIPRARAVISTMFDHSDTHELLNEMGRLAQKVPVVVTSPVAETALEFYKLGASYVIVPRILSSHLMEDFIRTDGLKKLTEGELKKKHIDELTKLERRIGL